MRHLQRFIKSFKRDDIHKCCILISDDDTYLITTFFSVPKLRYTAHGKNVNLSYIAQNNLSPLSPPGHEPGSLEYRSNGLTTKLQRHMMKKHAFHIKVPSDGYTSIPYTPLPECFLILHLIKAASKL